ncbi:mitochondrial ribosomal small subunit component [Pleosporales sp. CAS-2024a]
MFPTRALCARSVWKGEQAGVFGAHVSNADHFQDPTLSRKHAQLPWHLRHSLNQSRLPLKRGKAGERQPPIRTQARSATILPNFVGLKFQVHNGKIYEDITITEDMVGHKLGEFALTRKNFTYKQTKNK